MNYQDEEDDPVEPTEILQTGFRDESREGIHESFDKKSVRDV